MTYKFNITIFFLLVSTILSAGTGDVTKGGDGSNACHADSSEFSQN